MSAAMVFEMYFSAKKSLYIAIFFTIAVCSCSSKTSEVQFIEIAAHSNEEDNVSLAKQLILYSPVYISHKVPSFNNTTRSGIEFELAVLPSNENPYIAISYDLGNTSIVDRLPTLKSEFATFFVDLSKVHFESNKLFEELSPKGADWANSVFLDPIDDVFAKVASQMRDSASPSEFKAMINSIESELGKPTSIKFSRPEYYEGIPGIDAIVALSYIQTFGTEERVVTVRYLQEQGEWKVAGYNYSPN